MQLDRAEHTVPADAAAVQPATSISLPRTNISSNFAINLSLLHSFRTGPMTLSSCPLPTRLGCCMRTVYFDLGVSTICITCHLQPTNSSSRRRRSRWRRRRICRRRSCHSTRQSSLSVSININALSDNFFSVPQAQGSCPILKHIHHPPSTSTSSHVDAEWH